MAVTVANALLEPCRQGCCPANELKFTGIQNIKINQLPYRNIMYVKG
jgi:hypothetical protein